ncbi:hypothetical protein ACFRR7_27400 [Streptomyces sp. NPDC056909]|uniref:hypothetical protein n=1 Tax=Streptomyces sp. NPDC056909 TaxID=3345963 RepID=UPI0036B114BD
MERVGFPGTPRVLGTGPDEGKDVVSLSQGEAGLYLWPQALLVDEGVTALGGDCATTTTRPYAVSGPSSQAVWYDNDAGAPARLRRDETQRIARLGVLGAEPWAAFLRHGFTPDPDIEAERAWAMVRRGAVRHEELLGHA